MIINIEPNILFKKDQFFFKNPFIVSKEAGQQKNDSFKKFKGKQLTEKLEEYLLEFSADFVSVENMNTILELFDCINEEFQELFYNLNSENQNDFTEFLNFMLLIFRQEQFNNYPLLGIKKTMFSQEYFWDKNIVENIKEILIDNSFKSELKFLLILVMKLGLKGDDFEIQNQEFNNFMLQHCQQYTKFLKEIRTDKPEKMLNFAQQIGQKSIFSCSLQNLRQEIFYIFGILYLVLIDNQLEDGLEIFYIWGKYMLQSEFELLKFLGNSNNSKKFGNITLVQFLEADKIIVKYQKNNMTNYELKQHVVDLVECLIQHIIDPSQQGNQQHIQHEEKIRDIIQMFQNCSICFSLEKMKEYQDLKFLISKCISLVLNYFSSYNPVQQFYQTLLNSQRQQQQCIMVYDDKFVSSISFIDNYLHLLQKFEGNKEMLQQYKCWICQQSLTLKAVQIQQDDQNQKEIIQKNKNCSRCTQEINKQAYFVCQNQKCQKIKENEEENKDKEIIKQQKQQLVYCFPCAQLYKEFPRNRLNKHAFCEHIPVLQTLHDMNQNFKCQNCEQEKVKEPYYECKLCNKKYCGICSLNYQENHIDQEQLFINVLDIIREKCHLKIEISSD
ncbi:hypothetical protein PPERSA_06122 [Pseudocohnilembus persalinus]|uniref:PRD domain-containing protein n=1 Tax=Pseudocohnilembus persalinus TaxID=266149 RepID=A0A0V0QW57_PSEPJ|nr:hypothetical protein PPERSA_06122 [Pseudocohnilembus persalinus]|eukprot:KRX06240.1 hypothetical protein PPERSA_06122 [Pseudocohnilembus persalinus]